MVTNYEKKFVNKVLYGIIGIQVLTGVEHIVDKRNFFQNFLLRMYLYGNVWFY